nr:Rab-like protein 5 [Haemonchus contortus]
MNSTSISSRCETRVRIVEFESHELDIRRQRIEVDVELWDCSGDLKYRDCWPAIRDGIEGVILVANPDENTGEDLKIWYDEFIASSNLDPENVLIVLNEMGEKRTNDTAISGFRYVLKFKEKRQWLMSTAEKKVWEPNPCLGVS